MILGILETLQSWFESNWIQNAKSMKKIEKNRKRKEEKKKKNMKRPLGEPFGPEDETARGLGRKSRTGTPRLSSPSLTCGPRLSGHVGRLLPWPKTPPVTEPN
jgi:hypothetical protein